MGLDAVWILGCLLPAHFIYGAALKNEVLFDWAAEVPALMEALKVILGKKQEVEEPISDHQK